MLAAVINGYAAVGRHSNKLGSIEASLMARNRYISSFRETSFAPVPLVFNLLNLHQLLEYGLSINAPYTHQQICDWAQRFAEAIREEQDEPQGIQLDIVEDVGAQWDLFLYNTYSLTELQAMDFSRVCLPSEWFVEWLRNAELATA